MEDARLPPPFGQSATNSAQRRPSSSLRNRPSTAPSSFLNTTTTTTTTTTNINMPDSSFSTSTTSSSRTPSLVSSPATSFSSFTAGGGTSSSVSREEILPWESVSTIKQSGPKPTILSSAIVINSKILPPPPPSTNHLLHPTSPPSSSSSSRNQAPPPSSLQRSFSQRPTSLAYNLVTRPSADHQPPKAQAQPRQQHHYAQHPYSHPTSFGAGSTTRNFSAPGRSRAGLPPVSILSLAEGASTKGKDKLVPIRHYIVGTTPERDWKVLDQESLLGETMRFELGEEGKNTFVELSEGEGEPARVLDVGCGLGLWCIEQAQEWKSSHFVGLDLDPVQVDLEALVEIQKATGGVRKSEGGVDWEEVGKRVEWVQADFLKTLPFDSGSFDFVHLRWVNLGIPEAGWQDLLEEVARVLKKGTGILEIVETSNTLPPSPTPLLSPPSTPHVAQVPNNTTSPSSTFRPRDTEQTQSQSSYTSHTSSSASSSPSTPRHHTPTPSISNPNPMSGNNAFGASPKQDGPSSSQRTKYERHLETHLIQPTVSIVVRPALLMTSGLSKVKVVGDYAWSRDGGGGEMKEKKRAPGVLSEATCIWAESMFPSHPHHAPSHSPFLHPNPYSTQTAIRITTELHQTYGLEGYAPRAAPGSELKKGAGGRLKKLLGSSGSASPTSPPNGQVLGGGGKVESWVWVGRKTG